MSWLDRFKNGRNPKETPRHLERGQHGEDAARKFLLGLGISCLATNYRSRYGEIDLVCRDGNCLAFVEVKTRSQESWTRPADAVDRRRRQRLTRAALDFLRRTKAAPCPVRFDIVEVILRNEQVLEIRHLPNAFPPEDPFRWP